jgi:hypothetical protein
MRFATRLLRALANSGSRVLFGHGKLIRATTVAIPAAMALLVASALGVLSGSPSNFEAGDGNMTVEASGNVDWNCLSSLSGVHVSENGSTCGSSNSSYVSATDPDAYTTSDLSWKSGQKQDTSCPTLVGGKNPAKDTFTNIASYNETVLTSSGIGHTYLYGATIRYAANGNASENVELNQEAGTSTCSILRTAGDKLIAINYLNGGTSVQFGVLTWITSKTGPGSTVGENNGTCLVGNDVPPCWGAKELALSASAAEGKASQTEIAAADNGISGKTLAIGQFAEFGIDLTQAGIIPASTCKAFPQTVWESRSAGSSFTSNPEDIEIEKHTISNCGSIKVIKQTNPRGVSKKFSFASNLPVNSEAGGVACAAGGSAGVGADGSFCLNDTGNAGKTLGSTAAADNSSGNTIEAKNVPSSTYTITEGEEPTGFAFGGVTCSGGTASSENEKQKATITLHPGDEVVCVFTNNQQFGALKVLKTSVKAAATPLAGAQFSIKDPSGTALAGSPYTSDEHGVVCVDGLIALGGYTVKETKAPTGYSLDDETAHNVEVTATNAKCSAATFTGQSLTFKDTPLTDITASVKSQVSGGTSSTIECTDGGTPANEIGDSPKSGETATVTAKGLKPGTYTCKVVVDP